MPNMLFAKRALMQVPRPPAGGLCRDSRPAAIKAMATFTLAPAAIRDACVVALHFPVLPHSPHIWREHFHLDIHEKIC